MKLDAILHAVTLLNFADVPRNETECRTSEGELSFRADHLGVSCVHARGASEVQNNKYHLSRPHQSLKVNLISREKLNKFLKGSRFASLSESSRETALCAETPEAEISARNNGGLFTEFEVKVNGKKLDCKFKSRFGEGEREKLRSLKGRNFNQQVSYRNHDIRFFPFSESDSQTLIMMEGHQILRRRERDHHRESEAPLQHIGLPTKVFSR